MLMSILFNSVILVSVCVSIFCESSLQGQLLACLLMLGQKSFSEDSDFVLISIPHSWNQQLDILGFKLEYRGWISMIFSLKKTMEPKCLWSPELPEQTSGQNVPLSYTTVNYQTCKWITISLSCTVLMYMS